MKSGWEKVKLSTVCDFKSGTTIDKKLEKTKGEVIYAKVGDMNLVGNEDYITLSSRYVDLKSINQNQIIPVGSIIFPKRGGAIATNKKRRIINPTIVDLNTMALVPSKAIDKDYLFFWFQQIDLADLSNGTSIPQINNYSFDNVFISYPKSVTEQQSIVSILDQAFAALSIAKANAEQNLKNAKELFESYLQGVFESKEKSWERMELIEVCEQITDGSHFSPKSSGEEEYPYITVRDIDEDVIDFKNCKFISKSDYLSLHKNGCKPNSGDLLFSKDGTVGKVSLVDFEKEFVVLSSLAIIRPKRKIITSPFLKYALKNPSFLKAAIGMKTGVAIRRIILKNLKTIIICFPKSIKAQEEIVVKLDELSAETKRLEAIYQQKIADLEELQKSILQKALNGELKMSEPLIAAD
jgi:type I restriction enzyme, S subunit